MFFEGPLEIAGHKQVQKSVVIRIDPAGAGFERMPAHGHAGFRRHVAERPVAVVAIEHVVAKVSDVYVDETIVVVITDRHPLRVTSNPPARKSARLGHVGKSQAVAIVLVEAVKRIGITLQVRRRRSAVQEKQVQEPVVVEIQGGDASAHGFERVLCLGSKVVLFETQPGPNGDVFDHKRPFVWGPDCCIKQRHARKPGYGADHTMHAISSLS